MIFNLPEEHWDGERRTILKFCWYPTKIGRKIIWLESVYIEQEYTADNFIDSPSVLISRWKYKDFKTKQEYLKNKIKDSLS